MIPIRGNDSRATAAPGGAWGGAGSPPTWIRGVAVTAAAVGGLPRGATQPVLVVEDLSVRFRTEDGFVHAVDEVSFEVDAGEVLAVVGESGCGKTVTALSLVGLLPPSAQVAGQVRLAGEDLVKVTNARLRELRGKQVGFVFQEPMTSLNPVLTVGRQVGEVLRRHQRLSRQAALGRAAELLDLVGIPEPRRRLGEYPHQLSGGLRQRVMIAMAVACEPRVLIADEPTTALDVTIQAGILDLLRDLRHRLGTAVLLITHDLGVVADFADRVLVMYAGRKVEEAAAEELFAAPQHPYTVGLLGAVPNPSRQAPGGRLREIPGMVPSLSERLGFCAFAPRCPRADDRSRSERPQLEEVRPGHLVACFHPGPDDTGAIRGDR
jgi:peptide/nickel transport system ATP-binding protein